MEQTQELEKEYIEASNKILEDVRTELQSFGKQAGKVSEEALFQKQKKVPGQKQDDHSGYDFEIKM